MKFQLVALFLLLVQGSAFFTSRSTVRDNVCKLNARTRKYPLSRDYYERQLRRLNSKNITQQMNEITTDQNDEPQYDNINDLYNMMGGNSTHGVRIVISKN